MSAYRTQQRAVVHPLKGNPFTPYCDLNYKNDVELKATLLKYMRPICGSQKVVVDTAAQQILVNGSPTYRYELIAPAPTKQSTAVMY